MNGDELRAQLECHHQQAFGWALSVCRFDSVKANNVLQTAYVNVLSRTISFSARASFQTWWFAVIRNTAAELHRREWLRQFHLVAVDDLEFQPNLQPQPEETLADAQRWGRLRLALAALPQRQREVLHLVFYQDLSIAEAAQVMTVSLGSARRHYERAKQRLRERISAVDAS